jgi:hypothetical protein
LYTKAARLAAGESVDALLATEKIETPNAAWSYSALGYEASKVNAGFYESWLRT